MNIYSRVGELLILNWHFLFKINEGIYFVKHNLFKYKLGDNDGSKNFWKNFEYKNLFEI